MICDDLFELLYLYVHTQGAIRSHLPLFLKTSKCVRLCVCEIEECVCSCLFCIKFETVCKHVPVQYVCDNVFPLFLHEQQDLIPGLSASNWPLKRLQNAAKLIRNGDNAMALKKRFQENKH